MITIVSSTNRPESNSLKLAHLYQKILKEKNIDSEILSLENMPANYIESALYHNVGKDKQFNAMRKVMDKSEKFFFIIPEYNGSFPGILKTFIDGLSRESIKGKKAALAGLSAGTIGVSLGMSHFSDILNYLGCHVFALKPRYFNIERHFDGTNFTNPLYRSLSEEQIEEFLKF